MYSNDEFISKYEQFFSNRLFSNLPKSSEGVIISNIDFVVCDYKMKKFILIELKTKWNQMQQRQKNLYNMIHKRLMRTNEWVDNRTFVWTYCICFEWTNFEDWWVTIEWTNILKKPVDEQTLKSTLYYLLN
jgi:hypothetical protein